MKKAFFALLSIVFLLTGGLLAQDNSLGKSDADAKKVLDAVSAKLKSYKSVQTSFTLQIANAAGKIEATKKGALSMSGHKYHLTMTGQEVYCDGSNIWTYDKSNNEVTLTKYDASAKTISPENIFTNFYDKDFLYKLNGDKKENNKTLQEIELTPVNKTKTFYKVYLEVDKVTKTIASVKWLEKDGTNYTIFASKLNGNIQLSDAAFIFDKSKYPGVEEVDLRN
jgi:outer membrane lipoprotein carrier protein